MRSRDHKTDGFWGDDARFSSLSSPPAGNRKGVVGS